MSKTPRTDAAMFATQMNRTIVVHVKFAQQLETELADKDKQLAEAQAEIERCKKVAAALNDEIRLQRSYVTGRDATIESKDRLIEQMRTTLIATRNGLLIACDDNENNSRVKRFFGYIDSALAAERGE